MRRYMMGWLCWLAAGVGDALAYDPDTHQALTEQAARVSVTGDQDTLTNRGFSSAIDGMGAKKYQNSKGILRTLLDLLRDGAKFEDDNPRSLNHFFNPRTGGPLSINADDYIESDDGALLKARLNEVAAGVNSIAVASPDWVLGTLPLLHLPQIFSYVDLKNYYFQGLTNRSNLQRMAAVGLTFETLGRIAHHLQDMAQPQHVRNDMHLQMDTADESCPPSSDDPLYTFLLEWCPVYQRFRSASAYEAWTTTLQLTDGYQLPLAGYAPVYGVGDEGAEIFGQPRDFWISNGKGIAEFTNRNFLSTGTMGVSPPSLGVPSTMKVADLCTGATPPCQVAYDADDVITFYPSIVDDQLRPTLGGPNPFAAADSIFSWDLAKYRPGRQPERTVNRFTFAYDHAYLLPRAVAYSAGFINYFFRGDMQIELPDEGVYAIADQSPNGCGVPCGFTKVSLKLTNVTPGVVGGQVTAGGEPMGPGTLRAVVKHHLNTCYRSDLSGEYGGSAFAGDACRSKEEFVLVSAPYTVQSVSATEPQTMTFDFGATPIPLNASDVYLQVVFRGKLGMEDDAVAVSTTDTAESNFFAFANMSDYAYDTVDQKYHPLAPSASPLDMTNVRLQFDGGAGKPLATLPVLPGGGHAQVAYLTNKGSAGVYIQYHFPGAADSPFVFTELVNEFSADNDTGPYTRTCPVKKLRGLYRDDMFFVWQYVHGVVSWRQLEGAVGDNTLSAATNQASRLRSKAAPGGADCVPQEDMVGVKDFSAMTPQTANTAFTWNISFP